MVFENVAKRHQVSHQNLEEAFIRVPYVVQGLLSHQHYDDITILLQKDTRFTMEGLLNTDCLLASMVQ
jgi:hypothetical protein